MTTSTRKRLVFTQDLKPGFGGTIRAGETLEEVRARCKGLPDDALVSAWTWCAYLVEEVPVASQPPSRRQAPVSTPAPTTDAADTESPDTESEQEVEDIEDPQPEPAKKGLLDRGRKR